MEPKKSHGIFFVVLALFALLITFVGAYLIYQNSQLRLELNKMPSPLPSPLETPLSAPSPIASASASISPSPTATSSAKPTLTSPLPNSKVTSPLKVSGTAPAGWMFEGQLTLKLLDSKKKVITQGIGKETVPGSWQTGKPAQFSGTLTFTTIDTSGFLVVEAGNPSGLPENAKTYEVPVMF